MLTSKEVTAIIENLKMAKIWNDIKKWPLHKFINLYTEQTFNKG